MARPTAIELTIVALHGNGGGAFYFDHLRPFIPPTIQFRPLTLPGFDGIPLIHQLRSLHDYARYLRAMMAAEIRPLVLVAMGSSGAIALEVAQHFVTELDGLILQGPLSPQAEIGSLLGPIRVMGGSPLAKWFVAARVTRPLFSRLFFRARPSADYLDRFFIAFRRCAAYRFMFNWVTQDWFWTLQPITLPTILLGDHPQSVLTFEQHPGQQPLLPQSDCHPRPDWPPFPMIERPADYAADIVVLARRLVQMNG
jgi:hypothetical protein